MHKKILVGALGIFLLPLSAAAGHQVCGKQEVPASVRKCPDGSIPLYVADEIKPYVSPSIAPVTVPTIKPYVAPPAAPAPTAAPSIQPSVSPSAASAPAAAPSLKRSDTAATDASDLNYYFGVWRTRIPGAVWTSPSGYQGYDWLHVSAGVAAGDLIIKPDGTYVWQSYGGKSGKWIRGDGGYPIVLIDTVENRRWKVGSDPRHTGGRDIIVWDGNAIYYDGRK